MRTRLLLATALASALAWAACKSNTPPTPTVTGVVVSGNGAFTEKNRTSQLTATANKSDSTTQDVTTTATWSTSDSAVATVTSTGLVTSTGHGTASISAAAQGSTGSLAVLVTLKAVPLYTPFFKRLCGPFRAGIDLTIAETGGSIGFNVTALTIRFKDINGNIRVTKTYNPADLATALGGSAHLNAGQSKILTYEQSYTPVVETEDSRAEIDSSVTDDVGNVIPVNMVGIVQHDRC